MLEGNNILCVIPARGGSKRLPRKNILDFAGKPLIAWTIEQAIECDGIDRVVVSTEDNEIADVARKWGADVPFMRPETLASDVVGTMDVLVHALKCLEQAGSVFDILVLLPATSPLRNVEDIDNCLKMLVEKDRDNVFSVTRTSANPYFTMVEKDGTGRVVMSKEGEYRSMQAAPVVYTINGSVYAWKVDVLKEKQRLMTDNTDIYEMPKERSIDIDDNIDLNIAESIFKGR